jgi:exopolysaccharide biosynthesis polyprenyl glycosylphosphotransferase
MPRYSATAGVERGLAPATMVAPAYGERDSSIRRLMALGDAVAIVIALLVTALATNDRVDGGRFVLYGLATIPAWVLVFKLYGLYDRALKRISHSTIDDLPRLFHALLLGCLLMWAYYRVLPVHQLSLAEVATFSVTTMLTAAVMRTITRSVRERLLGPERVLVIGGADGAHLIRKLGSHPEYGLEPVGIFSPRDDCELPPSVPVIDLTSSTLQDVVLREGVGRVIVSHSALAESDMVELMRDCRRLRLKASVLPQLFDVMGPSVEVDQVEGITVLGLNPPVFPRSSRFVKRSLDIVVSSVLLTVALPLLALIALAIKLDTRGPVFFTQERIGKRNRRFKLVKFRTMVPGAERQVDDLLARSTDPDWLLIDNDPRVTRVGGLLRHSSLDELPQLWNVLKGEMSLVGPRPLVEVEDRKIDGWARSRLELTPGITGLWQVLGRTEIPFAEMVKLDYLYVSNWSLWTDVRLLLQTLPAVVRRRGVN